MANQEAHLNFISALKFDGLRFGKTMVSSLTKEFIKEQFWPELRRHGAKSGVAVCKITSGPYLLLRVINGK